MLLDDKVFADVATLPDDAFVLEKHRIIFRAYRELFDSGCPIEYMTLITWLEAQGTLDAVDGIAYIASLNEGLPRLSNIDSYVKIVHDRYRLRQIIFSSQHVINRAIHLDNPDELAGFAIDKIVETYGASSNGHAQSTKTLIQSFPGGLEALLNPSKSAQGLSTGFVWLDEKMKGLRAGELTIIGGRPGMGKTSLALNIMANVLRYSNDRAVLLFSLEMASAELLRRLLAAEARVDSHRMVGGFCNAEERQRLLRTVNHLQDWDLWIDDSAQMDVTDLYSRVRRFAAQHRLGLLVVDYLQLMESKQHIKAGRNAEVTAISRRLKLIAKEFQAPVMALSQLSRSSEKRGDNRPRLSDLRDSGAIEQDADNVLFVHREEVYKPDRDDLHGIAELIIEKQRQGPVGKHRLAFIHKFTKFENLAEDLGEEGTEE